MQAIEELQKYARESENIQDWSQFGRINATVFGNLVLLEYGKLVFSNFNEYERVTRGLILEIGTGNIVSRPFDKFFNYGEDNIYPKPDAKIIKVFDKIDGVMIQLFWHNNAWRTATRHSFTSKEAKEAARLIKKRSELYKLSKQFTYIFELIGPIAKVIVNYGDKNDLVLLAVRNKKTGEYLHYWNDLWKITDILGFKPVKISKFTEIVQIINWCKRKHNEISEGFVVILNDGTRWKFKTEQYRDLHRFIDQKHRKKVLSHKYIVKLILKKKYEDEYLKIPEIYREEMSNVYNSIMKRYFEIEHDAQFVLSQIEAKKLDRKTFSILINDDYSYLSPILFAMIDNKDYSKVIFRIIIEELRDDENF